MLCYFLLYSKENQLCVYIIPSLLDFLPVEVTAELCTELSALYSTFLLVIYFTHAAAARLLQSCLTLRPHRWQPTRLLCPWDSPGKNTGVGCHFLLQCMHWMLSPFSRVRLCDPLNSSPPVSSVHRILQARILEWVAISVSQFYTQ